ncbi:phage antirepressor KilAC domain-containing protein [Paenibacillus jilunlii]|uniref:Anti-repressor protein n=1 Tax=Paenibacillus jilunlii TaxID=682956 RepID=A0A1H0A479_9BACL|nr:phage antirepressor [Paenibacillus jilunlii]KWX79956.1 antirepressor [Paenibacillus jilunlii]SDN28237.1 anti-repressor protein [Paenibacillus jilunlii]
MNQLQNFIYGQQQVRSTVIDGEPWFIAKDVCDVLEVGNPSQAISRLDEDEKNTIILNEGNRGNPTVVIVNEPGLYSLILGSRKPEAKQFKRWITHEVIPSIRKHGAYMTPQTIEQAITSPDFLIQLANKIKDEQEKNKFLEQKIESDKPKVHFAESVEISKDSILVADLAKLLRQKGVEIGEHRLYRWLREEGYLIKSGTEYNRPTQRSMEMGLFEIKTGHRGSSDGTIKLTYTTKVTGKGQIYFINKFLTAA